MLASAPALSFTLALATLLGATTGPATRPVVATPCVLRSDGTDLLRLTPPPGTACVAADGSLKVNAPHCDVELWLVRGAGTIDDAVKAIPTQIATEFRNFKPDRTTDLTIANAPAKRLVGTGNEADDDDDGGADVIAFTVGGHVFLACTHGERLLPAAQQGLLALVQTAERP